MPAPSSFTIRPWLLTLAVATIGVGVYVHLGAPVPRFGLELAAKAKAAVAKVRGPAAATVPAIDADTLNFDKATAGFGSAPECFPMHLRDTARIGVLYLYCGDDALERDAQGVEISENFAVPEAIARRYNFWRRIYSLWGKDQYVMHLSQYPEVVVEAYDVSRVGDAVGPVQREIMVKRVAKSQRDLYRKLFSTMHRFRDDESQFTPSMQRLARSMAHISAKDKYLVAARSLRLQRGQRDFIASGLAVGPRYLPAIEQEFRAQGIPIEIARLAYVESSFNLKAYSKVGASGVFQIMPATGRQYLKIHSGVDERLDPIKASRAAAKLLKLNLSLTGSWPLAITAYNHGVGGIRRAVRATGSNDIVQLINRYDGPAFGFASKNFYASFLGVLATLKEADRLFPEVPKAEVMAFSTVRLNKATSIAEIRKRFRLTTSEIGEYNPDILRAHLRSGGHLPGGYVMKIPARVVVPTPPNT